MNQLVIADAREPIGSTPSFGCIAMTFQPPPEDSTAEDSTGSLIAHKSHHEAVARNIIDGEL